ncbi:MAG: hypothetical protein ACREV5_01055 [Steroidobacter sp.]
MARWHARAVLAAFCLPACSIVWAQEQDVPVVPDESTGPVADTPDAWIDRAHSGLHGVVWRSAMRVDRMFGASGDEDVYREQAVGSITPALFWSEFDGFEQKLRFRVKMPLPHLDERYDAFIGTVNREEFVTEREQESGALPRQGAFQEDQTLFGIRYRQPRQGGRWEADAGLRIRSPIDPYVKAGYRYERGASRNVLVSLRQTLFWQNSEGFGLTSRVDVERIFDDTWLVRWSGSGTISEKTAGVRGYTALTALRALPDRRAIAAQIFTAGEFDAAVPLREYGAKIAYRQSIIRDWLVLEVRPSITWPKTEIGQSREASWGIGVGFEMFFGIDDFSANPATF